MQLDPRHLIQFATIIEEASFSDAAQKLGTTQPALSNMVKNLELRTGLKLLAQRRRPVIPTSIGQELAVKGQGIRSLLEEADRETEDSRKGVTGSVRVGAPSFFCEHVLADLIIDFLHDRPKTRFDIRTGYNLELHDMVERREVDLALGPVEANLDGRKTIAKPLATFKHAIVCRTGHPILKKKEIAVCDLEESSWLSHSPQSALFQVMQAELGRLGITSLENALKSSSASALMQLLRNTDCLSVLPIFAVVSELEEGRLAIVKFQHQLPEVAFGLITQKHFSPSVLENDFITHVTNRLQQINEQASSYNKTD